MKNLLKLLDYIFVLQPVYFFPVWAIFLSGFYVHGQVFGAAEVAANGTATDADYLYVWIGLALTGLMGAIFILYQVMERNTGSSRNPIRLIASDKLTPKAAFIEAIALLVVVIVAGVFLAPEQVALFAALLIIAGVLYNFSPFKLKDRPIQAVLVYGLVGLAIFSSGWFVNGELSGGALLHAIPYAFAAMALFAFTSLPSEDNDDGSGNSFADKYGLLATTYVGVLLDTAALASAFFLADELIFYPSLFALPFFVWAAVKLKPQECARAVKYMIFLMTMSVSFKWHIVNSNYDLFLVLLALYLVSKVYYRLRFGIDYPSLSVQARS